MAAPGHVQAIEPLEDIVARLHTRRGWSERQGIEGGYQRFSVCVRLGLAEPPTRPFKDLLKVRLGRGSYSDRPWT